jgi:hypothetical protein
MKRYVQLGYIEKNQKLCFIKIKIKDWKKKEKKID